MSSTLAEAALAEWGLAGMFLQQQDNSAAERLNDEYQRPYEIFRAQPVAQQDSRSQAIDAWEGRAIMSFGVTGGDYQAAGQVHFLSQLLDRDLGPQEAAEVPRFFAYGGVLQLEKTIPDSIAAELARRGHELQRRAEPLGGCQAVWIDHSSGFLIGAAQGWDRVELLEFR